MIGTAGLTPLMLVYPLFGLANALPVLVATSMIVANLDFHGGKRQAVALVLGNVAGGFASVVLFPLTVAICAMADHPLPLLLSALPFFFGLCRMLYARMFEEGGVRPAAQPPVYQPTLEAPPRGAALPPYQAPVSTARPGATTGELAEPPSVTEHTTRLLDK